MCNYFEYGSVIQKNIMFKGFFSIFSSGMSFCSVEQNCLCNFGRQVYEEHVKPCEIIIDLGMWFKGISIFSSGDHYVKWNRTVCAIM